jgi:hypothetical protein
MNKRTKIIDRILLVFFALSLFLDVLNDRVLKGLLSDSFILFLFAFSLGLLLGYKLYYWEILKMWREDNRVE